MDFNTTDIKKKANEALAISTIKLMIYQELKDQVDDEHELKDLINSKPNNFFLPSESELKDQENLKKFVKLKADKILYKNS